MLSARTQAAVTVTLALAVPLLGGPTALAATAPAYTCRPAFGSNADPRVADIEFPSVDPARGPGRARVLLPSAYRAGGGPYPVLYLLHGAGDNVCSWTTNNSTLPSLEAFTAEREAHGEQVVIVMPDGGGGSGGRPAEQGGWYSDWFNGGALGPPRWEAFHIGELIPYIESHFRVLRGREHRVVAGLSMGGFGALSYAARHPDLFAAAFGFSSFADTDAIPYLEPAALAALHNNNNTPIDAIWGPFTGEEVRWRGHNPSDLVGNLKGVAIWTRTGEGVAGGPAPDDGDPTGLAAEAAVGLTNDAFNAKLIAAGVAAHYEPYPMGGHNWYHFQDDLRRAWVYPGSGIIAELRSPSARPAAFDYCSIEPDFSVWGWEVHAHRPATEFLSLQGGTSQGVGLRGSGAVDLASPGAFIPGGRYLASITPLSVSPQPLPPLPATTPTGPFYPLVAEASASLADPCASSTPTAAGPPVLSQLTADASGRLHLRVDLGPGHTLQEYTPQQRLAEAANPAYWRSAGVRFTFIPGRGPAPQPHLPGTSAAALGPPVGAAGGLLLGLLAVGARRRSRRNLASTSGPGGESWR